MSEMSNKPGLQKVIKEINGQPHVAVLYSPGFGAGWYTWNQSKGLKLLPEQLLFDPVVVSFIETKHLFEGPDAFGAAIEEHLSNHYDVEGEASVYSGGAENLRVRWLPEGVRFRMHEYDGDESVICEDEEDWIVA